MVQKFRFASIEQLAEVSVLKDLQTFDLIALQSHTVLHLYQKEEVVIFERDHLPLQLYALLQGRLRLTRIGTSGKETLLRVVLPHEIFAAPALVGDAIAPATVTAMMEFQVLSLQVELRRNKCLNNIVEQDHRGIKRLVKPGMRFGSFNTARRTLKGYKIMHMLRKGRVKKVEKGAVREQVKFIAEIFEVAA